MRTAELRRIAREGGLLFAPDPGAAEQSQIGGNVATNAGGPHAFKYGVTGKWVTGLEVVVPPGRARALRWAAAQGRRGLRPEAAADRIGGHARRDHGGVAAADACAGGGLARDRLLRRRARRRRRDRASRRHRPARRGARVPRLGDDALRRRDLPGRGARQARSRVLAEADGSHGRGGARSAHDLLEVFGEDALALYAPETPQEIAALWRWRDGLALVVDAQRGGKASEDIAVPLDRLGEAIEESLEIGRRLGVPACSWGHAGDGNLHTTFLLQATTSASSRSRRSCRRRCSSSRSASAARSPASTASASSSATGSSGNSARARSSCTARSSARSTRRTCSTRGRRLDRGDPAGIEAVGPSAPGVQSRGGRPGRVVHRCRVRPVRSRDDARRSSIHSSRTSFGLCSTTR